MKVPRTLSFLYIAFASAGMAQDMPRTRHTINEQWRYTSGTVAGAERPDFDDREWQRVNLPHTWNAVDAFDKTIVYRRGIGWYRKQLTLDAGLHGKRLFLYFE